MNHTAHLLLVSSATARQSPEQELLDIDGTVFITLGIFVILLFVLSRWLWKPYLRVRSERVTRVDGYKEDAVRLEAEAAARLARCQADLAEARRLGSIELARARTEAHVREQAILSAAQAKGQKDLVAARAQIETAFAAQKATLAARAQALGQEAAERILGRKVAP